MLIGRKQLIAAAALAALFLAPEETQAGGGGYKPCMVQPVFVRPLVSAPLFTRGEIVSPVLAKADSQKWSIDQPDFESPTLVQPVIIEARYDGCAEQAARKSALRYHNASKIEGKVLLAPLSAASRIMKGADDCCGNAGGR